MQHFAQMQQQNWGMGCMNGMGMMGMVIGMQNMHNMQHRYPEEREWERPHLRLHFLPAAVANVPVDD